MATICVQKLPLTSSLQVKRHATFGTFSPEHAGIRD